MKWKIFLGATVVFFALILGSGCTTHWNGIKSVAANLQTRAGEISSRSDHAADSAKTLRVQESYGKLPLYFMENQGQFDDAVKFFERGHGHSTFFTPDGVVFAFQKTKKDVKEAGAPVMKLAPLGMNKDVQVIPEDRQQGTVNYFIGNDPAKWRTSIPTYGAVVYKEAYRGVDIKFYGNNRQIEYDIVVKPGADPSRVNFRYSGVANAIVNASGDLRITLADGGELIQKKPLIYQETDGKRLPLEGGFVIETTKSASALENPDVKGEEAAREEITQEPSGIEFTCGFKIASYDNLKKLIIDPVLVYSTYLEGSGATSGCGIAVDSSGNAYVTGGTNSIDFPVKNPLYPNQHGYGDAFVTKINPSGTALVYSTYLGGSGDDSGSAIAVDSAGNAYVTGATYSTDFPVKNALYPNLRGSSNAFVTKINPSGTALVYSTYLGGSKYDSGSGIAVDSSGNAYVTGQTGSTDFPVKTPLYPNLRAGTNAFVAMINSSGTVLVYSTYLGGGKYDSGSGIAVDSSGNAYVTGTTQSSNFPVKNPLFPNLQGSQNAFVTKINSSGTALVYSTYLGGSGNSGDSGYGIAVDSSGNAYVTGATYSTDFPVKNPLYPNLLGACDAFVTKINSSGTALAYSTYLGGSYYGDFGHAIAVDGSGNAYVTGRTWSSNFPVTNPIYPNLRGQYNAFVTKINPSGTALVYSTYLGGSNYDAGWGIAVDGLGNAYVTGFTTSTDFPVENPIYPNLLDGTGAFVTKISDSPLQQTGSLTVAISPQTAVSAGAMWSVNGGSTWKASGATVTGLAVGNYTLTFKPVTGWTAPATQLFNIANGQNKSLSGTYIQQTGSLKVTITPSGAVSAGAMWSVNGGASWNASGATVSLAVGSYTLTFKSVTGWNTPANQTAYITNGLTTSLTGTYVQQTGSLTVTISPAAAVSAGAMWNVDGGAWQASGTSIYILTVGQHTVAFKTVNGWNTPPNQTANIIYGQNTPLTALYVQKTQTGSIKVTITPPAAVTARAAWSVNGGSTWNASGATVTGLVVGRYTLTFKSVTGWTTPASQSVMITNGGTATPSGVYVQQTGSLKVTITPTGAVSAGAMWSVNGGSTWNASGATVTGLVVGSYTLTFKSVTGWNTPASQSVTITNGGTATPSGVYLQAPTISSISGNGWSYTCPTLYNGYLQVSYPQGFYTYAQKWNNGAPTSSGISGIAVTGTNLDLVTGVSISDSSYSVSITSQSKTAIGLNICAKNISELDPMPAGESGKNTAPTLSFNYCGGTLTKVLNGSGDMPSGIIPTFFIGNQAWGQCTWYAGCIARYTHGQSIVYKYDQGKPLSGNPTDPGFPIAGSVLMTAGVGHMVYIDNIATLKTVTNKDGSQTITYALYYSQYNVPCGSGKTNFNITMVVSRLANGAYAAQPPLIIAGMTMIRVAQ